MKLASDLPMGRVRPAWLSLVAAAAMTFGSAAHAQDTIPVDGSDEQSEEDLSAADDSTELGTIQVTGSKLRRTDFETAQPVLVMSREDIERTGLLSIGDILQDLPQAGAALNTAFNNGGTGATEIDLRNLGSNRVLVLVNGRRWVGGVRTLNTSGVDLNTIPLSIIDSIEILKDGASAVYGSDAIAGVINIKTRRDFDGFELGGRYKLLTESSSDSVTGDFNVGPRENPITAADVANFPLENDGPLRFKDNGQEFQFNISAGNVTRDSSTFIDINYTRIDPVFAGSRQLSSVPTFGLPTVLGGTAQSRGSLFPPTNNILFVPTNTNSTAINNGQSPDDNNPDAICYAIAGALATGTGVAFGEAGIEDPLGELDPNTAGVDLCVGYRLESPNDPRRGDRLDYGHQYVPTDFNRDGYNFAPINYLITPQERTSIYGQYALQLTPDVRFTSELLYNNRRSEQQLAHQPLGAGDLFGNQISFGIPYVASDNPFNPTNPQSPYYIPGTQPQDIGRADAASGLVGLGAVTRRMLEGGPRIFQQNVDTFRLGGGLEGQFLFVDRFWGWDAGLVYNESRQTDTTLNTYNMQRVARALGPVADCIGDDVNAAPQDANGCVPLDLFGPPGSVTQAMLDYVQATVTDIDRSRQYFAYGNATTEFDVFADYLAGPVGMAFGGEYRKEFFESTPDDQKVQGVNANLAEKPTKGSYDVQEAFVEFGIPVIAGIPFVEGLDLSLASRFSEYGILDRTFTNVSNKLGIEYRPFNQLLVRTTISEAFRAPAITDLFLGASKSQPVLTDPCSGRANDGGNVDQNCDEDGVPQNYSQSNNQLPSTFGGNPDLEPESADTKSLGFVYSPEFIQDFNVTVDWYNVKIDDVITFPGAQTALDLCYRADPNNRQLCDKIDRDDSGNIQNVDNTAANLAQLEVEGVDVNMDWRLPFRQLDRFGSFKVVVDAAYVTRLAQTTAGVDGNGNPTRVTVESQGQIFGTGGSPRLKVNSSLDWDMGPWNASWAMRYIHDMEEPCFDGRGEPGREVQGGVLANPTPIPSLEQAGLCDGTPREFGGIATPTNDVDSIIYHDVLVGFNFAPFKTQVTFGINNVFNTDPPNLAQAFSSSYDPTLYLFEDSREAYVRFKKDF